MSYEETLANGTHDNQHWRLIIESDPDVENPRKNDNLWTLVCAHRRMNLGDHQLPSADGFEEVVQKAGHTLADCLLSPVYMFEHGNVAFSRHNFHDRFDSGQLGQAFVPLSVLKENYGEDTPETREQALVTLDNELSEYQDYVNGEGYAFRVETQPVVVENGKEMDPEDDEWTYKDGCSGFLGSDPRTNGMMDYLPDHVKEALAPPKRTLKAG